MKLISSIASTLFVLPLLSSCNFSEAKIINACETALKDRLNSPSEYKRVEITRSEKVLSRQEYEEYLINDERRNNSKSSARREALMMVFDHGRDKPVLFTLFISYDAPNAYGTTVRGIAQCSYMASDGDDSQAAEFNVRINGKTKTEWLLDAVRQSNG